MLRARDAVVARDAPVAVGDAEVDGVVDGEADEDGDADGLKGVELPSVNVDEPTTAATTQPMVRVARSAMRMCA